jgi:hypothetical protein
MTRTLLLFTAILLTNIHFAQDITIYGFLPSNDPDTEFLKLAHMDATTGNVFDVDSIYPVNAYALGSSTFDAYSGAYMFIGVDTGFTFRMYSRSTRGFTIADPQIGETINDLQFDMNTTLTYGIGNYKSDSVLIDSINNIWQYEYAMRFLSVDQDSGMITELERYPDLIAFPAGSSTFDANNGRYIVNAYDTSFIDRLCIIGAETGNVLSKDPTGIPAGTYLNNLEYNNEDDKVYGFYRDGDGFQAVVSIDPDNQNEIDTIYVFNDLQYFVQGSSVLHQASQTYMFYYIDTANQSRLALVDVIDESMPDNPAINTSITELQVDNTAYALAKYHETVDVVENTLTALNTRVYPNPASGFINTDLPENAPLVRIISLNGATVFSTEDVSVGINRFSIDNLLPGIYIMEFYFEARKEFARIVIR